MRAGGVVVMVVMVGLGAAAVGFLAGRATADAPAPAPVAASPPAPAAAPGPVARRAAAGMVCAALDPGRRSDDDASCEALELRARWCEGQLDQCTRERKAVRQPWPSEESVESPEAWSDAVEQALAECELGAELELVECTEYPCVAALRPANPALDEDGHEQEMKRLTQTARACSPLRAAFGLQGPEHDEAIDVWRLDARCGEGREELFVLSALSPAGPAWSLVENDAKSEQEERDFFRWLYRRADDVSGLWPCAQ